MNQIKFPEAPLSDDFAKNLMRQNDELVARFERLLHEQLGQTIAAIRITHETVIALDGGSPATARMQRHMVELIEQAVQQVRQGLRDLHSPMPEVRVEVPPFVAPIS